MKIDRRISTLVVRPSFLALGPEALERCPSLDQRAVHSEVFIDQNPRGTSFPDDFFKEPPRRVVVQKALPIARETVPLITIPTATTCSPTPPFQTVDLSRGGFPNNLLVSRARAQR
jgi:hypothetical protein